MATYPDNADHPPCEGCSCKIASRRTLLDRGRVEILTDDVGRIVSVQILDPEPPTGGIFLSHEEALIVDKWAAEAYAHGSWFPPDEQDSPEWKLWSRLPDAPIEEGHEDPA